MSFCEPPPQDTSPIHQGQDWLYRLVQEVCRLGAAVAKLAGASPPTPPPGTISITATPPIQVTPSPITGTGDIEHQASGVVAATYGDASNVPQIAVNATGHVTSATNVPITNLNSFTLAYLFGDGRDGDFVLDGTNTYSQLSKVGNDYTCNQWLAAHDVTINAGCTLHNGNMPMFMNGTLTNNGKIGAWGADAVNGAGGVGIPVAFYPLTHAGSAAALLGGNGSAFTAPTLTYGGGGGNGGAGNATSGGTAPATTPPGAAAGGVKSGVWVLMALYALLHTAAGFISNQPECAGAGASGGGDNGGTQTGGGGGAPAGYCFLAAFILAGNGTISCKGGRGGDGTSSTNAAGAGGGGGGGCLWFCTTTPNPTSINTFTVAGGDHGTPSHGGGNGTNGTTGNQYIFVGT